MWSVEWPWCPEQTTIIKTYRTQPCYQNLPDTALLPKPTGHSPATKTYRTQPCYQKVSHQHSPKLVVSWQYVWSIPSYVSGSLQGLQILSSTMDPHSVLNLTSEACGMGALVRFSANHLSDKGLWRVSWQARQWHDLVGDAKKIASNFLQAW